MLRKHKFYLVLPSSVLILLDNLNLYCYVLLQIINFYYLVM